MATDQHPSAGAPSVCPMSADRFDPFAPDYLDDPYPTLQTLRETGEVVFDEQLDMWVVTRWEDVHAVFADTDTYSAANAQDPLVPLSEEAVAILATGFRPIRTMSNLDGPEHTRIRRHNQVGFSPRRLRAMEDVVRQVAVRLIDQIEPDEPVDIVASLTFPLPAEIIFALLGFPAADTEMVKQWCGDRMAFSWGRPTQGEQSRIAADMVDYWQYCERHIERRLADPADDFTSDLLAIHRDEPEALSLHEVTHVVYGLSFAGHETTTNLLTNAIRRLLDEPDRWASVCADPDRIPAVVDEVLRHDSSVIAWRRQTTCETTLGSTALPAGAKILLMLGAANRDPDVFDEPDTFDPERGNAHRHLSFGFGKHYCLGATLTKIEMRVVLEELAARRPDLRLDDQQLTFHPNVSFRGPQRLLVSI